MLLPILLTLFSSSPLFLLPCKRRCLKKQQCRSHIWGAEREWWLVRPWIGAFPGLQNECVCVPVCVTLWQWFANGSEWLWVETSQRQRQQGIVQPVLPRPIAGHWCVFDSFYLKSTHFLLGSLRIFPFMNHHPVSPQSSESIHKQE